MDNKVIKTVCFVGAGTMGSYNSLIASLAGYQVTVFDINEESLTQVAARQLEFAAILIASGYYTDELVAEAMSRIICTADLKQATADADLVSESVIERLDIKRQVHLNLDEICPPNTILTTNSSTLLVSDIEDVVQRGDRFAALHTHLLSPLVDIVAGPRTSPKTVELLNAYVLSVGGVPLVLKKENPGYLLNSMLSSVLSTALLLVVEDNVGYKEIDRSWMRHFNAFMGPFGMMDMFGLNIVYDGLLIDDPHGRMKIIKPKLLPFIKPYIDKGTMGVKTGEGFYSYPDPAFKDLEFLNKEAETQFIYQRLSSALVVTGLLLAANGVAEPDDIDKAWIVGTFIETAPFAILKKMGVAAFKNAPTYFVESGMILPEDALLIEEYLQNHLNT